MKLSAVISTYNSALVLEDCLKSLKFADEIVIVDHKSTDDTVRIARKYTKHIFSQPNDPEKIDLQKNYGFEKANTEWVLSLDADERVSDALAQEIKAVITSDGGFAAYRIPRKNIIFGKWIEHSIWWPDLQLRLFQKGKGKYAVAKVHQDLQVEGTVGQLQEPLVHENYQSISQYLQKMDMYTENEANNYLTQNAHFAWIDAIRMPVHDFLKTFFFQEGYKDGFHGLVLSTLQGFYMFLVITKVWEKQGFRDENPPSFLSSIVSEWESLQKEVTYWFLTSMANTASNPLKKIGYRLKRKYTTSSMKK